MNMIDGSATRSQGNWCICLLAAELEVGHSQQGVLVSERRRWCWLTRARSTASNYALLFHVL